MTQTMVAEGTLTGVMADLAALEDPKIRAVNERHGDDHGVNLGKLRALAKRLKITPSAPADDPVASAAPTCRRWSPGHRRSGAR